MNILKTLDVVVDTLLPSFFSHFNSWMLSDGVSVLGFCVAVGLLCVVINAILLRE